MILSATWTRAGGRCAAQRGPKVWVHAVDNQNGSGGSRWLCACWEAQCRAQPKKDHHINNALQRHTRRASGKHNTARCWRRCACCCACPPTRGWLSTHHHATTRRRVHGTAATTTTTQHSNRDKHTSAPPRPLGCAASPSRKPSAAAGQQIPMQQHPKAAALPAAVAQQESAHPMQAHQRAQYNQPASPIN